MSGGLGDGAVTLMVHRGRRLDLLAVALLLVGVFILIIGWVIGMLLLWSSVTWSTRQKLAGTLLLPGGLGAFFMTTLGGSASTICSGTATPGHTIELACAAHGGIALPMAAVLATLLFVVPITTCSWLYLVAKRA